MRARVALLTLLSLPAIAFAQAKTALDAFTRGLSGLDGQFVQRVYDPQGQLSETTQGRVALARPRQFRWEYAKPFPQLIVADGERVWVYDPDLEQVSVRAQGDEERQSPLAVLIEPGELERRFDLREDGARDGFDWLALAAKTPSDDAPLRSARLGFGDGQLRRMELRDALDQRTVIEFSGWQRNPDFAPDTFRFTPPPGTDVVGDMADGAEVLPLR